MMKKLIVLGGVIALLAGSAQALLTIKNVAVTKDGPVNGAVVQIISGSDETTTANDPYCNGTVLYSYATGADGVASFTESNFGSNTQVYVKAWSGQPGAGQYFGYAGPYSIGLPKDTFRQDNVPVSLTLQAVAPAKPSNTAGGYQLSWVTAENKYKPAVTISINQPGGTELSANSAWENKKYRLLIRKKGVTNWNSTDPGVLTINTDSLTVLTSGAGAFSFLTGPGNVYESIAMSHNVFGDSSQPEGALINEFFIPDTAGAGPQSYVLTFEAGADGKPGINFFSMPVPPSEDGKWYAETLAGAYLGEVANAYQLINAINSVAGTDQGTVSTFGRWNNSPAEQRDDGVLIPNNDLAQVTTALSNIPLKQGEGYQVYVNQRVSLRIKNTQ